MQRKNNKKPFGWFHTPLFCRNIFVLFFFFFLVQKCCNYMLIYSLLQVIGKSTTQIFCLLHFCDIISLINVAFLIQNAAWSAYFSFRLFYRLKKFPKKPNIRNKQNKNIKNATKRLGKVIQEMYGILKNI